MTVNLCAICGQSFDVTAPEIQFTKMRTLQEQILCESAFFKRYTKWNVNILQV